MVCIEDEVSQCVVRLIVHNFNCFIKGEMYFDLYIKSEKYNIKLALMFLLPQEVWMITMCARHNLNPVYDVNEIVLNS